MTITQVYLKNRHSLLASISQHIGSNTPSIKSWWWTEKKDEAKPLPGVSALFVIQHSDNDVG